METGIPLKFQFPELIRARESIHKCRPLEFRRKQLTKYLELFQSKANQDRICEALHKDMRKHPYEVAMTEILGTIMEIQTILRNFNEFTAEEHLPRNLTYIQNKASIRREPHGVVLIFGTWNYPFYIPLVPVAGAIAAGNCVLVKPSEISSHSAALMAELIPQYLDRDCYHVVLGDAERTKALLTNKFDYIFFTGSTSAGRSVMQSAAPHLTPVTLELGGKSPVYIDSSVNMKRAARRLVWGKLLNMGQTCIAPDYIICTKEVERDLISCARDVIDKWYGGQQKWKDFDGFTRIINLHHFNRLKNLLDRTSGSIEIGGRSDEADLWIEPTFVVDVKKEDALMESEIFGPIFPFITVDSVDDAIDFMQKMPSPLSMYIFSHKEDDIQRILSTTRSGSVCINDTILQAAELRLPFGGTGDSGMGQCHGKHSVETFSHKRAVLRCPLSSFDEFLAKFRYPPFEPNKLRVFNFGLYNIESFELKFSPIWSYLLAILFGYFLNSFLCNYLN